MEPARAQRKHCRQEACASQKPGETNMLKLLMDRWASCNGNRELRGEREQGEGEISSRS